MSDMRQTHDPMELAMPGNRPHHTDKFRRCVEHVMDSGKSEDSAYAICTTTLKDAGEPIFEAAEEHMRHLHLHGVTGKARVEMFKDREHLVVPVVALMEGVIHAVNAETPEFVPLTTLQKAAHTWNGLPVVLGHPKRDGKQCSANSTDVLAVHGCGVIRNSRVEGRKMLQEAWIDREKAREMHPDMLKRLEDGESEEVSVGAYVVTNDKPGVFGNKRYQASWIEAFGDHLALLPGGRGACSIEMGCGTHRAASMHFITAERIGYKDCPMCKGTGSHNGNPCEACDGTGEIKVDTKRPRHAELKAASACGCSGPCSCKDHSEVRKMEKSTRAELIATLVTDRYSGFKDGDEAILEAASDHRLEEFRAASDIRKSADVAHTRLETDFRNTTARLKVAEDRLKVAEAPMSEEEFLARAPESFKRTLEARKAEEDAIRASLVSQLKDLGANTEEELKQKSTKDLQTLAKYAGVQVADFSGRGLAVERQAEQRTDNYAPPDPYGAGLKAMRAASDKIN